jgi:hypothetical protein
MVRWSGRCGPALLVLVGCSSSPPSPAIESEKKPAPTASAAVAASTPASTPPAAPVASGAPLRLVVAGDEGIREIAKTGTVIRVLSKTPAVHPRFLGPEHDNLVFYAPGTGEVRKLALPTSGEAPVGKLPGSFKTCEKTADYPKGHVFALKDLRLEQDRSFVVDAAANAVCFELSDRNDNMVNVKIQGRMDLTTGVVVSRVAIGGDCGKKPAVVTACVEATLPGARSAPTPFPLASLGLGSAVTEETISPSGKWSVIGEPTEAADYIHRSLFLLDRSGKQVYPIAQGPLGAPLTPAQRGALASFKGTVDAVGESPIRWLGSDDTLLVDALLVAPGGAAITVKGNLAR